MTIKQWYIRIKNALLYKCGVHFPYSKVRVRAMRRLGYKVGKDVYFPADIAISMTFVDSRGEIEIGDRVSIGPSVTLLPVMMANYSSVRKTFENSRHGT